MPNPTPRGPRLYRLKDGRWIIRDTGRRDRSTGTRDRRVAEAALARYLAEMDRPAGPATPDQVTVAAVLTHYASEHGAATKAPDRIGYAIAALAPILGALPVGSINGEVCRYYERERRKATGTVRRELGVLRAAINRCHAEGHLTAAPRVRLPAKPAPRSRWLTRDEVAKLLRAARKSSCQCQLKTAHS